MKDTFFSAFKAEMEDFLLSKEKTFARASYNIYKHDLLDFDTFVVAHNISDRKITEDVINLWIRSLSKRYTRRTVAGMVNHLRLFEQYLKFLGVPCFIPEIPKVYDNYVPYVFSDSELEKIFTVADNLIFDSRVPTSRYVRFAMPMLVRLLYCCGLRLGETLALQRRDIDFDAGVLTLRVTKNKKQRYVPMHVSLNDMLYKYCSSMGILHQPEYYLFPRENPEKLWYRGGKPGVAKAFKKVLQEAGIYMDHDSQERGQCLHCLRHLFAIKAFKKAEEDGKQNNDSIPMLSLYLGHYDMDSTEKYLKFSSDVYPEYMELFEDYVAIAFSGGTDEN